MLKRLLLSTSVTALFLTIFQTSAKATIQFPESCRMEACWITTLNSKEALRSNEYGTLYAVEETTNIYPRTSDLELAAQDYQRFVDYHGTDYVIQERQEYVFCSTKIPSVLFESEGMYTMKRLAVFTSPSNADRYAHQIYLATCHNLAGPDYFSLSVQNLLLREGYTTDYVNQIELLSVPNILEAMKLYPNSY